MKNKNGFTIVEVMAVIAIVAILSAIAIPNFIAWRSGYQLTAMARETHSLIQGARAQAIKENSSVTLTFDNSDKKIQSVQTNRVTGNVRTVTTNLRTGLDIASDFVSNALTLNSRGLPANSLGGTVTITNADGEQLQVIVESTGKSRIDKP